MKVTLLLIASVILINIALSERFVSADDDSDFINPNWIKPGWRSNRHRPGEVPSDVEKCQCPTAPVCKMESSVKQPPIEEENNRLALVFYRKFVTKVFDERFLEVDTKDSFFKLRNVQFKITDRQLGKLKEAQTARDIDAVVTSIVEQSEGSTYHSVAETLCWNFVALYSKAMQSSVFLYVAVPAVVFLFILYIGRLLHMRLWVLVPFLGILITYVLTYRDCNNRLELESLRKLMKTGGSNPCGKHHQSGWFNRLMQKNDEAECIEHLRETYGLKRNFCDPSEVFIEMVAKLQLQYFETFVQKMVSIFKVSTASSGLVETLLISVFILLLIYLMVTVGIKYTVYASGRFLADIFTRPWAGEAAPAQGAQLPPATHAPINISISISKPRRVNSRAESNNNRIEEIEEGGEPRVVALPPAAVEETAKRKEDGSGDGPVVKPVLENEETDEHEYSDDESVLVQYKLADDAKAGVDQ